MGCQLAQATIVTDSIFRTVAGEALELRQIEYTVLTLVAENPGGSLARLARALSVTAPHSRQSLIGWNPVACSNVAPAAWTDARGG